ncbi:uracil phosphoribosyltransferase [Lishizhenia sp.]|uniref:uracil phosphoribosyltransferase n=1 Tax=Lishizhenia sp. TaxID=2497594 RepID=UPI00299DDFC3|nr:uracil phosphoribosyltransferase [Lishizhenia sp.]MDX1446526.1 uracil phosphoribosyltransferase [Lishizhenia sp.]
MIHDLSKTHSIFNNFMAEIRDVDIQKDSMRFRRNLERTAELLGYEVSKKLNYSTKEVTTPLGIAKVDTLDTELVLATILRAGLPMHQGLLNIFDKADSAFVSAYRKHKSGEEFEIRVEYLAAPSIDRKDLIISDPMLATGSSMVTVYKELLKNGNPRKTHIIAGIAAPEAIEYVQKHLPPTTEIWVGAIDDELTAHSYIVPGCGDAGDIAFGDKL